MVQLRLDNLYVYKVYNVYFLQNSIAKLRRKEFIESKINFGLDMKTV